MRVIIKEPGKQARWGWLDNTLPALQEAVGGYIETVTVTTDVVLIVNEEGLLYDLPENRVLGYPFRGTVVACGVKGDEFADVPIEAMSVFTEVTA